MSVQRRVVNQLYGDINESPDIRILRKQRGDTENIKSALIELAIGIDKILEQQKS